MKRVDLHFEDIRRGSWMIDFSTVLTGLFALIAYDLVKENPKYRKMVEYLNKDVGELFARKLKGILGRKKRYGTLIIDSFEVSQNGNQDLSIFRISLTLRPSEKALGIEEVTPERELRDFLEDRDDRD